MFLQKYLKTLLLTIVICSIFTKIHAQQVYSPFVFNQLPQDFQLYARNSNNVGIIPIAGLVQEKGWRSISVLIYRENVLHNYQKVNIQVNAKDDSFTANPTIKSEKAEYNIFIYASRNDKDSVLITSRKGVVAGDFYVIYGDSNGNTQNVVDYYPTNKYIRTFGRFNQDAQKNYSPRDTTWSQNENYFLPRVGTWGTMLQELIVEKYDIPVCIITGGGPGMYIDLLSDRVGTGLNSGGVYNTLGYRIQKSGLINDIKGFFFWHGVYELFSRTNPVEYDAKLKQIMRFLTKDFPSVQQFIVFQSGLVRFNLDGNNGASIRESQRNMANLFPKVIPYAVEGLSGYDGVHYTKQGYANCANEMMNIIEPLFYKKSPSPSNNLSPNVQKIFYTDETHKTIKLVFQENQKLVLGKDTTVRSNGQTFNLSLKNNFFQDNNFAQPINIQSITSSDNAVNIISNVVFSAKKLSYLPPFHKDYSDDFQVFVGPYLNNVSRLRALAFNGIIIQEPLNQIKNLSAIPSISQVKLMWDVSQFAPNSQIIVERKSEIEQNFQIIKTLKSNIFELIDINLLGFSVYNYQLKVVTDSSESLYSQIVIKTLESLAKPKLISNVLYNNKVQVSWGMVSGAEKYIVSRRLKGSNQFVELLNNNTIKTLIDSSLLPNQSYIYKIVTSRGSNEFTSDSVEVVTPALLTKPELVAVVLSYNSMKITWKPISGSVSYHVERKAGNEPYKKIINLDNKTNEWIDVDLKENTNYSYRFKAFGDKTESPESEISSQTFKLLSTPELSQENATHESVKLLWKLIPSADKYVLERQAPGETSYQKIFESNSLLEFIDKKLNENSTYLYQLKAFNNTSESNFAKITVKTLKVLSKSEEEILGFSVFPNPTNSTVTLLFNKSTSGNVSLVDLSGKMVSELNINMQMRIELDVSKFKKGIYLVLIKTNQELYTHKIIVE